MLKKFDCFLTSYLKIPANKIRTYYNEYCDILRRQLMENKDAEIVQGEGEEGEEGENGENQEVILVKTPTMKKIYIYPLDDVDQDNAVLINIHFSFQRAKFKKNCKWQILAYKNLKIIYI